MMTDNEIEREYATWDDETLSSHRDAAFREAAVQFRWGAHQAASQCRARAQVYARALNLRGIHPA